MSVLETDIETPFEFDLLEFDEALAEAPTVGEPVRFVTFAVGDGFFGIPVEYVAEVSQPLPIRTLPNSPASLLGISPLRGEIVAVMDVRLLLGAQPVKPPQRSKFIVMRASADESQPAFPVDTLFEISNVPKQDLEWSADDSTCIVGIAKTDRGPMKIVDPSRLAAALGI